MLCVLVVSQVLVLPYAWGVLRLDSSAHLVSPSSLYSKQIINADSMCKICRKRHQLPTFRKYIYVTVGNVVDYNYDHVLSFVYPNRQKICRARYAYWFVSPADKIPHCGYWHSTTTAGMERVAETKNSSACKIYSEILNLPVWFLKFSFSSASFTVSKA